MSDPVYKGCTRPAMLWGVPLIPLMLASFPLAIAGFWGLWLFPLGGVLAFAMIIPIFLIMKFISKSDDQRLLQYILRLKMSLRHRNSRFWGAKSYGPVYFKKRHDE